jgi:hypothetical protein
MNVECDNEYEYEIVCTDIYYNVCGTETFATGNLHIYIAFVAKGITEPLLINYVV